MPPNKGEVHVIIVTADSSSVPSPDNLFTYIEPPVPGPLAVTGLSPTSGPTIGGTIVRIEGTDLGDATSVMFGSIPAESFNTTLLGQNAVAVEAVSPCGQGIVPITITTRRGTSVMVDACKFAYQTPFVLGTVSFADQAVGTSSAPKSATVPLQVSLHDLPPDFVVPYGGDNLGLNTALRLAGLGPQFTVGQFIAAFGDVTLSFALAGVDLDRGTGRDFSQTAGVGGPGPDVTVPVVFTPTAKGFRADVLRASVGGAQMSGSGLAGQLASLLAPFFGPLINDRLGVLVEGNGV
ncbi:MAG TPA: IPT/TIG domain-containing protein [Candidatus Binatia bacterium]|nr:IPT/TIG domain-containing protein [Candidatus Binatia bacterium]